MSTVGEVADRVFRDWLHAPEDQPVIISLSGDVTAAATSWPYSTAALAPDEEELLAPGVLVEAGPELARIRSVDSDTDTLTVTRGVNGTEAQAHSSGDEVMVAPTFARSTVVEAVKDNVVALYPMLWRTATTEVTISTGYADIPADAMSPVSAVYLSNGRPKTVTAELLDNWPPSSTGKAILTYGVPNGNDIYFTWKGKFARPLSEDTELYDVGVESEWERIVAVGAAAQVIAGRDLDALTAEFITEQLQRDALPVDATQRIRNGLLTLYNIWINEAHSNLRADQPPTVVMNQ